MHQARSHEGASFVRWALKVVVVKALAWETESKVVQRELEATGAALAVVVTGLAIALV